MIEVPRLHGVDFLMIFLLSIIGIYHRGSLVDFSQPIMSLR